MRPQVNRHSDRSFLPRLRSLLYLSCRPCFRLFARSRNCRQRFRQHRRGPGGGQATDLCFESVADNCTALSIDRLVVQECLRSLFKSIDDSGASGCLVNVRYFFARRCASMTSHDLHSFYGRLRFKGRFCVVAQVGPLLF